MKTICIGKRITIRVPTKQLGWCCLILALASIVELVRGNMPAAFDLLQLALLLEILGRLPQDA